MNEEKTYAGTRQQRLLLAKIRANGGVWTTEDVRTYHEYRTLYALTKRGLLREETDGPTTGTTRKWRLPTAAIKALP
jgi:hypothetical protein